MSIADFPLLWNFRRDPRRIDPRAAMVRATTARYVDPIGKYLGVPANAARTSWNPNTGFCNGFLSECQRTNLLLYSEDLTQANWVKTSATITSNSTVALDGATTADTLTATGASGNAAQAITITAGRGITLSVHAKASATNFLYLEISDGVNTVGCWFNLNTGVVGTNTAGASTVTFLQKTIENFGGGWYRCALEVATATSTSITCKMAPTSADNVAAANTNACIVWGAQAEADGTHTPVSSYIPTTSASVTRNADSLTATLDSRWFNAAEGTLLMECTWPVMATGVSGQSMTLGGLANTFADCIYLTRQGASSLAATIIASSVGITLTRTLNFTQGATSRIALAWKANDGSLVVDGGAPATSTSIVVPSGLVRAACGIAPWAPSGTGNGAQCNIGVFALAPKRIPDAHLQTLTVAG